MIFNFKCIFRFSVGYELFTTFLFSLPLSMRFSRYYGAVFPHASSVPQIKLLFISVSTIAMRTLSDLKTAEDNLLLFRDLKGRENAINRPKKKASTRCSRNLKEEMLLDDGFCVM